MTRKRRYSDQTRVVLVELAAQPSAGRYGYELSKSTGLASGTLYPILMRLEQRGLLDAQWELTDRRPRHVYRLTPDGLAAAEAVRSERPVPRVGREAVA